MARTIDLKERLAKFVGFRYLPYKDVEGFGDGYCWVYPDWAYGNGKWGLGLPSFIQCLNVLFKKLLRR